MPKPSDSGIAFITKSARSSRPAFEAELSAFLRKALGPTVSSNVNSSRTDVLIEAAILDALSSRTILDVCCGWPLLLHKLIHQRENEPTSGDEYCYVACDTIAAQDDFKLHIENLRGRAAPLGVTIHDVLGDAADPKAFASAVRDKFDGLFDLILFSNALHEVRPRAIPDLLFTLVSLLDDAGRLVIIDPDPTWLLEPDRWNGLAKLSDLEIDWEAAAVWLPSSTYSEILKGFGCTVTSLDAARSQAFWVLQATRPLGLSAGTRDTLVSVATARMRKAVSDQWESQVDRYIACRNELRIDVLTPPTPRKLMYKALEFFSVCASQARRVEVFRDLK